MAGIGLILMASASLNALLGRDDLMLKDSEYDALERASVIVAGLAAFQTTETAQAR